MAAESTVRAGVPKEVQCAVDLKMLLSLVE